MSVLAIHAALAVPGDPTGMSSPLGRLVVLAGLLVALVVLLRWWWFNRRR
jgi:hypothetical protein